MNGEVWTSEEPRILFFLTFLPTPSGEVVAADSAEVAIASSLFDASALAALAALSQSDANSVGRPNHRHSNQQSLDPTFRVNRVLTVAIGAFFRSRLTSTGQNIRLSLNSPVTSVPARKSDVRGSSTSHAALFELKRNQTWHL